MDPFSHYMFAWLIGRRLSLGEGSLKLFLVVTLLPDFDMASLIFGFQAAADFHGTVTHSAFVALPLGALASIILARVLRVGVLRALKYGVLAIATHLSLDLFNLGMYLEKGQFLWPVYLRSLTVRYILGIPLQFSLVIYLTIFFLMFIAMLYFWRKNDPLWRIWFELSRAEG